MLTAAVSLYKAFQTANDSVYNTLRQLRAEC